MMFGDQSTSWHSRVRFPNQEQVSSIPRIIPVDHHTRTLIHPTCICCTCLIEHHGSEATYVVTVLSQRQKTGFFKLNVTGVVCISLNLTYHYCCSAVVATLEAGVLLNPCICPPNHTTYVPLSLSTPKPSLLPNPNLLPLPYPSAWDLGTIHSPPKSPARTYLRQHPPRPVRPAAPSTRQSRRSHRHSTRTHVRIGIRRCHCHRESVSLVKNYIFGGRRRGVWRTYVLPSIFFPE
jgi:hypothetical protein